MIAKNEEDWLRQCLLSVQSIVTEVILVDTGSTDTTAAIANEFGARVLHRPWDDDFSGPRNLSLSHARGDWILVLDADEAIAPENLAELQSLTLRRNQCFLFPQRHYSNDVRLSGYQPVKGEFPAWERAYPGFFESSLCRLFPNGHGIEYRGRVHELVEHSISEKAYLKLVPSSIRIHHYGHTPEVRAKKKKGSLYTPLGAAKLIENPNDWKGWFELGVEHNNNGRLVESVDAFRESLKLLPTYLPSWINLGYVLCELQRYQEAEEAQRSALKLDPRSDEAYCNLGVVYLRTKKFPQAEECFRRAVHITPHYVNALCNLGKTLAFQGRFSESAHIYERALDLQPTCIAAKMDLSTLYISVGLNNEAKRLVKEISTLAGQDAHTQAFIKEAMARCG